MQAVTIVEMIGQSSTSLLNHFFFPATIFSKLSISNNSKTNRMITPSLQRRDSSGPDGLSDDAPSHPCLRPMFILTITTLLVTREKKLCLVRRDPRLVFSFSGVIWRLLTALSLSNELQTPRCILHLSAYWLLVLVLALR